ncbi:O-antigen ligase family protein [Cetobacterium sp.]|uniref:O-antigen ligase family protein n=1 Tax=Cetobacterium sp. TaxID=2071632 RepID=UPI003F3330F4
MLFAMIFFVSLFSYKIFGIKLAGITLFLDRIILPFYIISKLKYTYVFREMYRKSRIFQPILFLILFNMTINIFTQNLELLNINFKFLIVTIEQLFFFYIFSTLNNKKKFIKYYFYFTTLLFIFGIFEHFTPTIISDVFYEFFPMTLEQKKNIFQLFFRGDKIRISLFSTHALAYGTLVSLHIPFIISQFYKVSRRTFILNFILGNINLYFSFSRAASLTVLLVYLYFIIKFLFKNKGYLEVILKIFIVLIFIMILAYLILKIDWRVFFPEGKKDRSISMRFEDYTNIFSFIHNNFLFGTFGNTYFNLYNNAVDNYFLNFFFSYGFFGLLCLVLFFIKQFIFIFNTKNKYLMIIFYQVIFYNLTFDFFGFLEITKYYFLILGILYQSNYYQKSIK